MKKKPPHAPAPWAWSVDRRLLFDKLGAVVVRLHTTFRLTTPDARLIEAAPTLLQACVEAEGFLAGLEGDYPDALPEVLANLRAAIAEGKAPV